MTQTELEKIAVELGTTLVKNMPQKAIDSLTDEQMEGMVEAILTFTLKISEARVESACAEVKTLKDQLAKCETGDFISVLRKQLEDAQRVINSWSWATHGCIVPCDLDQGEYEHASVITKGYIEKYDGK